MRFVFKTSYRQDMGLFRDGVQRNWYAALLAGLLLLPLLVPAYLVDISLVFIYGLCGLSLMVLAGYTGLVSLGHAAFLGIGAYAHVYFTQDLGLPWLLSVLLAAGLAGCSIPSWVPLVGKDKRPASAASAKAESPAPPPAPHRAEVQRLPDSQA